MRKLTLLLCITLFSGNINAIKYSDKNYLSVRPHLANLAMQQTTWHTNLYQKPDAKYNGTIQVTPFYQESTNKSDIGKYFGFDWTSINPNREIENIISVQSPQAQPTANGTGIDEKVFNSNFIIHNQGAMNTLAAEYYMNPNQEVWGARIDYHQDLDKILNGLYFRISTPIVEVKNHFEISPVHAETSQIIPPAAPAKTITFLDYLAGRVENTNVNNLQDPLKYVKIDGATHSSSGFADIDIRLGYKYLYKRWMRAGINASVLAPTGKTPKGEWLFEPVHGNGHHWGIGVGADLSLVLWQKNNKSIEFSIMADYKYLFQGIEKRTMDFFNPNPDLKTAMKGGQYILGGHQGVAGVFPLANILTQDFKITPGSQLDGIANLNINCNNWIIDLGYNLFIKEREEAHLRFPWENDKYAMAGITYDTANNFLVTIAAGPATTQAYAQGLVAGANASIQESYLDYNSIISPNAVSHKIYGGIGYQWNKYKYPAMLGIGGSYEFVQRNSALEGWSVWTKLGISW